MNILPFVFNRLIKIFANTVKMLCYVFHYIFPKKRYLIPLKAKPWLRSGSFKKTPRTIWQTNYTNLVSLPVYINYLFNRLMAPTYEYRFMGTQDRLDFIKENFSAEITDSYNRLNIGASQADFWRLLVLNKYGGVYLDIDAHLVWPLDSLIKPDYDELYVQTRKNHYTNYFIASKSSNPNLQRAIEIIIGNVSSGNHKSVYELTGPPVLNKALEGQTANHIFHRYACLQGSFTNEYFQYIDKPNGKWTHIKPEDLIKK